MQDCQVIQHSAFSKPSSIHENDSKSKFSVRSLGYTFTLFNYTEEHEEALKSYESKFLIYGKELTKGGVPHLQGYFHFACPGKTIYALQKLIKSACWFPSKGSIDQNIAYCSKMGDFYHQGKSIMSYYCFNLTELIITKYVLRYSTSIYERQS